MTFFSKFTSPEQSYLAALHQDHQHPVQQHLQQHEIQKTGVSEEAPSSFNNDTIKAVTAVQQIMT
jgi:hypothetical protein